MNYLSRPGARLTLWTLALIAILLVLSNRADVVWSQTNDEAAAKTDTDAEDIAPEEDAEEDTDGKKAKSLGDLVFKRPETTSEWVGLAFYLALFVFSIVAVTVALERGFNLTREKIIPRAFVDRLRDLLRTGRDSAEDFRSLGESSSTPIGSILRAGVLRAGRPLLEVEKGMEDAAAREVAALRGRNHTLSVIGGVAPLVGLLGTVVGMIFAFQVSSQAGLGKAELLAKGIYIALLTTAGGLSIAIPCMLLAARYNGLIDRFLREIDECLLETMPSFARMETDSSKKDAPEQSEPVGTTS